MKKCFLYLCAGLLLLSSQGFAAQPTTINYSSKGTTFTGKKYRVYTVRCSDGKQRKITSWRGSKKWCVGKGSDSSCSTGQLKAAAKACR